ncbi:MAG: TIGR03905 family TSCPD domain-containing protein [Alphaproteobacteria bacterium]|nr:TIGR03905 family TSCPD domain-containing protein [Alphaproteobacteria bacterium]
MQHFSYTPQGVCAQNISFDIKDGKIFNVQFIGGCMGNLCAIAKLVEGKEAKEIATLLKGNDCRGKGTSCADQLSKAIMEALTDK